MNRSALRFWGSAAATSIVFAALVPLLFPFRAMGMDPAVERDRVWLVVVFYTGVLMILFGLGAWISGRRSVGLRDIVDAGGVKQALDRADAARAADEPGYTRNAAAWAVVTGVLLLVIYFALYAALG
ncbi:hypothetical protein [Longimicrobium sp.]|uniref:hypothetical protein n=1 Tax=Longimicrobium sp. TaxID=2029185 RepID=UPI002E37B858|nr:hypothetical protein [Longimicrobium sp.]HEX6041262.1 hypothetical protein [Longimicrobium sp.]